MVDFFSEKKTFSNLTGKLKKQISGGFNKFASTFVCGFVDTMEIYFFNDQENWFLVS